MSTLFGGEQCDGTFFGGRICSDLDGDGLPDWWVDLHTLSLWNDRFHGTGQDHRFDLNVDGQLAPHLKGSAGAGWNYRKYDAAIDGVKGSNMGQGEH